MATPLPDRPVALVTGASAGIGRACADCLAGNGWAVIGASRRGTASAGWAGLVMDVDDNGSVAAGVSSVLAGHPRLDAVVACAGWGLAGAVEDTPLEDARDQVETNLWGVVRVVQQVLPTLRRQGGGRLVLMSSIGGTVALPFQAFYSASKFALEGFAEALAYEVGPFGVDVTLVEPGNVRTDFTDSRRDVPSSPDSAYAAATARTIGKMAEDERNGVPPERVADAVLRVLQSRKPRRRVSVGRLDERVGVLGKRLIPYRLFERAARGSLGV